MGNLIHYRKTNIKNQNINRNTLNRVEMRLFDARECLCRRVKYHHKSNEWIKYANSGMTPSQIDACFNGNSKSEIMYLMKLRRFIINNMKLKEEL